MFQLPRANAVTSPSRQKQNPRSSPLMEPPPMQRQVAEIAAEPDRATAYARLLHLQRGCADDPSAAADLAAELPSTILPLLLRDAAAVDEAVADSALRCLGFALYHPVLLSTIPGTTITLLVVLCARIFQLNIRCWLNKILISESIRLCTVNEKEFGGGGGGYPFC